jgi:hypothetical protein
VGKQPPQIPENRIESANSIEPIHIRPKIAPYEEDVEFISQEFDVSGDQREKNLQMRMAQKIENSSHEIGEIIPKQVMSPSQHNLASGSSHVQENIGDLPPKQSEEDVTLLMNRVLMNKKQLEESISDLNGTLQSVGFELRPIGK